MSKEGEKVAAMLTDKVSETIKDLKQANKSESYSILEKLAEEYQTATVTLLRQSPETGRFDYFYTRKDQDLQDLINTDFRELAKEEGGKGTYKVELTMPSKEAGKMPKKVSLNPFSVNALESYPVAKSEMEAKASQPFNPLAYLYGGAQPFSGAKQADNSQASINMMLKYIGDSTQRVQEQNQVQTGNFMQILGMLLLKDSLPGANGGSAAKADNALEQKLLRLEEQLAREREERTREERLRQQETKIEDLRRALEQSQRDILSKLDNKSNDSTLELMKLQLNGSKNSDDSMVKMMMMAREDNRAAQERFDRMMLEYMKRPDDSDRYSKVVQTSMENSVQTLNLMTQIATSGLLGGGEDKDTLIGVLREAIQGAREAIPAYFQARYGGAGMEEVEEEAPLPIQAPPTQVESRRLPEPLQQVPQQGQSVEQDTGEGEDDSVQPEAILTDPEMLKRALLTEDELESIGRDRAAAQIFKALRNNDVKQATARLFGLARTGHEVYGRWMSIPGPITSQVLNRYGLPEYMFAFNDDIVAFLTHLDKGGNPNDWSEAYQPVKTKEAKEAAMKGPATEFGVQYKEPEKGDVVDSSKPPSNVNPQIVERQRRDRERVSAIDRLSRIKENIEQLQAGKLQPQRIQWLRDNQELPAQGQEQQTIDEIDLLVPMLKAGKHPDEVAKALQDQQPQAPEEPVEEALEA